MEKKSIFWLNWHVTSSVNQVLETTLNHIWKTTSYNVTKITNFKILISFKHIKCIKKYTLLMALASYSNSKRVRSFTGKQEKWQVVDTYNDTNQVIIHISRWVLYFFQHIFSIFFDSWILPYMSASSHMTLVTVKVTDQEF